MSKHTNTDTDNFEKLNFLPLAMIIHPFELIFCMDIDMYCRFINSRSNCIFDQNFSSFDCNFLY